jgi:hypothetical protein
MANDTMLPSYQNASAYSVRVFFQGEWLTMSGACRVSHEEAVAVASQAKRHGDRVRIWHAVHGYIETNKV